MRKLLFKKFRINDEKEINEFLADNSEFLADNSLAYSPTSGDVCFVYREPLNDTEIQKVEEENLKKTLRTALLQTLNQEIMKQHGNILSATVEYRHYVALSMQGDFKAGNKQMEIKNQIEDFEKQLRFYEETQASILNGTYRKEEKIK